MTKIKLAVLASAMKTVEKLELAKAEQLVDEIAQQQPNLFGAVMCLHQMGHKPQHFDVMLDILLTIHVALKGAGVQLEMVTEAQQEKAIKRYVSHLHKLEKLSEPAKKKAMLRYKDAHGEPYLMAYVLGAMTDKGIVGCREEKIKDLILVANMLINCVESAKAKRVTPLQMMH